jgi:exonuclease SbcC
MELNLKPKSLKLQGFKGIFYAFGRDTLVLDLKSIPAAAMLVCLIGPNGAGKTTILDNLQPYRCMPSRSTTLGPGGFSYWEQIMGTSALKELEWEHAGVDYRTVLSFRVAGKTAKADCYLYRLAEDTQKWVPMVLPDGTVSDGKAATYDRCVDDILGPPERFFTAQFSAQKRKTIAQCDVGDIKSILASVLNLDNFHELSGKSNQVAKFIKQRLDQLNGDLAEARKHDAEVALTTDELNRIAGTLVTAKADEQAKVTTLDGARQALSLLEAKIDTQARDIEERKFLTAQIANATTKAAARRSELLLQTDGRRKSLQAEVDTNSAEQLRAEQVITNGRAELVRQRAVLVQREKILAAGGAVEVASEALVDVDKGIEQARAQLRTAAADRAAMQRLVADKAALKSQGEAQTQVIVRLKQTAALIEEVPCRGSALQGQCKLLVNANDAAGAIPENESDLVAKRAAYEALVAKTRALQVTLDAHEATDVTLEELQRKRRDISEQLAATTTIAAKKPLLDEAERRVPALEAEIAEQERMREAALQRAETLQGQLQQLDAQHQVANNELESSHAQAVKEYQDRLDSLTAPVTEAELNTAKETVGDANRGVQEARARLAALVEQQTAMVGKLEAARALAARSAHIKVMAERCIEEIALWKRLEKGLGNDGCIALSIDDAGPEIAVICNNLLKECFAGRFVVRLDTQTEQKNGNLKETFKVTVFDSSRGGDGKPLSAMSGGEEVLVNECLTRAIALYASQSNQKTSYQTLFTDETDGALDPKAKRTFMAMKRAVLAEGGYEREYFITHTPELWGMADHTINVAEL